MKNTHTPKEIRLICAARGFSGMRDWKAQNLQAQRDFRRIISSRKTGEEDRQKYRERLARLEDDFANLISKA